MLLAFKFLYVGGLIYSRFMDRHEVGARSLKIDPVHIWSGAEWSGGASAESLSSACCGNAEVDKNGSDVRAVSMWKWGWGGCSHLIAPALRRNATGL